MWWNGTQDQNEKQKMSTVNIALGSLKYSDEWMGEYPFQSTTPQVGDPTSPFLVCAMTIAQNNMFCCFIVLLTSGGIDYDPKIRI
jgi:hypothetical protein